MGKVIRHIAVAHQQYFSPGGSDSGPQGQTISGPRFGDYPRPGLRGNLSGAVRGSIIHNQDLPVQAEAAQKASGFLDA